MPPSSLSETISLVGLIARAAAARATRSAAFRLRRLVKIKTSVPDRLLISPQDIRTADPTIAGDIYAGHLVFGGSFVDAHGQSPFEIEPPSEAWAEALHGFGWLRHQRAANTMLSRANARALVDDWMTANERAKARIAWRPSVVARRLLSWLSQSPMILTPPDAAFYRRFMRSIGRQTAFLQCATAVGLSGEARLSAAIALAEVGLCAESLPGARRHGTRRLIEELGRQILPDGGHVSRNPDVLVDLLLDLLPLRQSFAARSAPVPPALLNAIDRIIPMIRLFRHGDGTLALFNGMGVTEPDVLATVLTYDDIRARPLLNAPHSGYQRAEAGGSLLICDIGAPPPREFSDRFHAGVLSFEFSAGPYRLIVNCGRAATRNRRVSDAARSTAAHSTLVIGDVSSSRFAPEGAHRWLGEQILSGPRNVTGTRRDDGGGCEVTGSHDGYANRFGLIHTRHIRLAADGRALHGDDTLKPVAGQSKVGPQPYALRFHLHPSVRAQPVQGGQAILLVLPNDDRWLFEANGAPVVIEESILFAAAQGARPTSQVVVAARFPDQPALSWSLTQLDGAAPETQTGTEPLYL